ncbi:peptidase [Natrinema caseinilyticum]|uniref:peptidase n=1 Tax=Natrinema caseinilyticum TaxID=2961570 RepID=UPI0020C26E92|nr:peptidase [Natrinema caseinilyticum]
MGRLYGVYSLRRDGDTEHRSRGTYRVLFLVGIGAGIALTRSGLLETTEATLSAVYPTLAAVTPLVWTPVFAGSIVVVLATYLGIFPYARTRRGLEISAATAVARLAKYLLALTLFVLGVFGLASVLLSASDPHPVLIPVVFVVLTIGVYSWSQYRIRLTQAISEPTDDHRQRLATAADRASLTATIEGVFPGRETEVAGLYLDGPFWNRRVYATDHAFDVLDDDELTALCARLSAADEAKILERQALTVSVAFGLFVTLSVWVSFLLALAGVVLAWLLLTRHLQRVEFAADRRAARAAEADSLTSAYETGQNLSDDRSRVHERLASTPSRARRLERLREMEA